MLTKDEVVEAFNAGFHEQSKLLRRVKEEMHDERLKQLEERVRRLEKQQISKSS